MVWWSPRFRRASPLRSKGRFSRTRRWERPPTAPQPVTAPCRVVYVIDEPNRRGFAYGTLPGHPVAGEELFLVQRTGDGRVTFGRVWTATREEEQARCALGFPSREEQILSDLDVRRLFVQAIAHDDAVAMREGIERLFGLTGDGLSPEAEYRLRHEDYVMTMPQSGERIRGRDAMRAMQEAFPVPPSITLRRVVGSGQVWVVEGINDYAGEEWHVVAILELEPDGSIIRDTRYYTPGSEAPAWRAEWVEPID